MHSLERVLTLLFPSARKYVAGFSPEDEAAFVPYVFSLAEVVPRILGESFGISLRPWRLSFYMDIASSSRRLDLERHPSSEVRVTLREGAPEDWVKSPFKLPKSVYSPRVFLEILRFLADECRNLREREELYRNIEPALALVEALVEKGSSFHYRPHLCIKMPLISVKPLEALTPTLYPVETPDTYKKMKEMLHAGNIDKTLLLSTRPDATLDRDVENVLSEASRYLSGVLSRVDLGRGIAIVENEAPLGRGNIRFVLYFPKSRVVLRHLVDLSGTWIVPTRKICVDVYGNLADFCSTLTVSGRTGLGDLELNLHVPRHVGREEVEEMLTVGRELADVLGVKNKFEAVCVCEDLVRRCRLPL